MEISYCRKLCAEGSNSVLPVQKTAPHSCHTERVTLRTQCLGVAPHNSKNRKYSE
jgi:hypothetical protein